MRVLELALALALASCAALVPPCSAYFCTKCSTPTNANGQCCTSKGGGKVNVKRVDDTSFVPARDAAQQSLIP